MVTPCQLIHASRLAYAIAFALAYDGAMKALTRRYEYLDDIVPHLPPHTGSWFQMFQGGQAVGAKIAVAASPAALAQKPGFDALLKRVGQVLQKIENHTLALDNYVSVGTLEFIDWADKIQGDSWSLSVHREVRLAELLLTLQFLRIAGDHSSDGGYLKVPCR
ncbi:hypothetical protein [Methylomagnum ishizawai]|uniref:hypothetical protein n=1 Tax=Methylomagnum ishizawai TaxID=1760988 RepID=UPI001C335F8B|nr:hypothetical protein [Methylomagnum ishizawai]BBL76222.1 hypothetical protein MishRS11D_33200 [Methylomagnum ishizawai]